MRLLTRQQIQAIGLEAGDPVTRFDTFVEWILAGLLAFMPFAFGVVDPWSETLVMAALTLVAGCLAIKHLTRRDTPLIWSWSYLPLALFILLCLLQLVALPAEQLARFSPNTLALRERLLSDLPASSVHAPTPISFAPWGTRHDLAVVIAASVVFLAVIDVYRRPAQIKRMLAIVAAVGGAVSALALLQDATLSQKIYWSFPLDSYATAGPFVNYSHFSQFTNLSVGATLGLLLVKLREGAGRTERESSRLIPGDFFQTIGDTSMASVRWLAAAAVAGLLAVPLSLSRGGLIASLAALAVFAALVAKRQRLSLSMWLLMSLSLAAVAAVVYGGSEALHHRLAALGADAKEATGGRLQVYQDVLEAWKQFPLFGMGLGSFEFTYPMFDRSEVLALAEHADSDYFQLLHETGAVGVGLMLAFVLIIGFNLGRAIRARRPTVCVASYGLLFGLIAVIIHSMTDFGQHLPSIATLSAISCGLVVNLSRLAKQARNEAPIADPAPVERTLRSRLWPARALLPLGAAALAAWALLSLNTARLADDDWRHGKAVADALEVDGWQGSNDSFTELLTAVESAAAREPDNVQHRYWLNVYRWRAVSRATDPDTGGLVMTPESLGHTARIVDDLRVAWTLCPTFGAAYSFAGQLDMFVLNRPSGAKAIERGYELAKNHPQSCFAAAQVDITAGRWDASMEKLRRCLVLQPSMLPDVVDTCVNRAKRPDLAVALARDNPLWLVQVARNLQGNRQLENRAANEAALRDAVTQLRRQPPPEDAGADVLALTGELWYSQRDYAAAAMYFRKALEKNYGQVQWRLILARSLAAEGKYEDAVYEANICLRLHPQMEAAKQFLQSVRGVRPTRIG